MSFLVISHLGLKSLWNGYQKNKNNNKIQIFVLSAPNNIQIINDFMLFILYTLISIHIPLLGQHWAEQEDPNYLKPNKTLTLNI